MPLISRFSPKEVSQVFEKARRVLRHPGFTLLVAPKTQPLARILIVTSRKVGNAPARNKIRRRLRAIFYEAQFPEKNFDCVVIVKAAGTQLSFDVLKELIVTALNNNEQITS